MTVCLRCDWRGDGAPATCPRCGEPVFRPAAAVPRRTADPIHRAAPSLPSWTQHASPPPRRTGAGAGREAGAWIDVPDPEPDAPPERPRRSIAAAVASTVSLLVLVSAVAIVTGGLAQDPARDPAGAARPPAGLQAPPLSGSLVYSRLSPSAERLQLWVWDLARHVVEGGPVVPKPVQLVAATTGGTSDVGLTWRRPDGRLEAGLVDPADPQATVEPVLGGDLVAWSPRGGRVSAATLRRTQPCPRRLAVRAVRLDRRVTEQAFRTTTCGDVVSLSADGAVTYFTLKVDGSVHVAYGGISRPTIVLRHHALLGVSWAGDMIVQRTKGPRSGTLSYFNRRTTAPEPRPVPFDGDPSFAFGGVLAWAPNAFEALVVGTAAGRPSPVSGVYLLDTLPGDGIDPPRWVMEASGPTSATYTRDGVGIVATGGDVFAIHEGAAREIPLPLGAPLADGRVAWIP